AAADLAFHAHPTAVSFHEALHDGQTQSGAAELTRGAAVHLVKALEYFLEVLAWNSHAAILHRDSISFGSQLGLNGQLGERHHHAAALSRELHRVGQQIDHHLPKLVSIRGRSGLRSLGQLQLERDPFLLRLRSDAGDRRANYLRYVHRLEVEAHLAGLDLADVQDRRDQLQERLALVHDGVDV